MCITLHIIFTINIYLHIAELICNLTSQKYLVINEIFFIVCKLSIENYLYVKIKSLLYITDPKNVYEL